MKVSFCTSIKNRLAFLRRTLPENIKRCPGCEMVVLDFDSNDGLRSWIEPYVMDGNVKYFRVNHQPFWRNAYAKNICHLLATGDVVCNLDADIHVSPDLYKEVHSVVGNTIYAAQQSKAGISGFIACLKSDFISLGGYSEELSYGWGCEDLDFIERAKKLKFTIHTVSSHLAHMNHDNHLREQYGEINDTVMSNHKSLGIMKRNLILGKYIANQNRSWGCCKVVDWQGRTSVIGQNMVMWL